MKTKGNDKRKALYGIGSGEFVRNIDGYLSYTLAGDIGRAKYNADKKPRTLTTIYRQAISNIWRKGIVYEGRHGHIRLQPSTVCKILKIIWEADTKQILTKSEWGMFCKFIRWQSNSGRFKGACVINDDYADALEIMVDKVMRAELEAVQAS